MAKTLFLDKFMIVANHEIRDNENVLCDVCEAVIGAIFMDAGCDQAVTFVNQHWKELIDKNVAPPKDNKTLLQEVAHSKGMGNPLYEVVGRSGSEHEPTFFYGGYLYRECLRKKARGVTKISRAVCRCQNALTFGVSAWNKILKI